MLLPCGFWNLSRPISLDQQPLIVAQPRLIEMTQLEQPEYRFADISHMNRHLIPHRLVGGITREHEWGFTTFRLPDEASRTR